MCCMLPISCKVVIPVQEIMHLSDACNRRYRDLVVSCVMYKQMVRFHALHHERNHKKVLVKKRNRCKSNMKLFFVGHLTNLCIL